MTTENSTESKEAGDEQTRPFADILLALNRGRTHHELSTGMQQLVAAVEDTGKKGSISLTITVAPTKSEGVLEVTETVGVKAPTHSRAASLFYADDSHNLVREDPRQMALPLRDVTADPADRPLREAH